MLCRDNQALTLARDPMFNQGQEASVPAQATDASFF
jgi:hypothetical protein